VVFDLSICLSIWLDWEILHGFSRVGCVVMSWDVVWQEGVMLYIVHSICSIA
jgi:hypothetical protein